MDDREVPAAFGHLWSGRCTRFRRSFLPYRAFRWSSSERHSHERTGGHPGSRHGRHADREPAPQGAARRRDHRRRRQRSSRLPTGPAVRAVRPGRPRPHRPPPTRAAPPERRLPPVRHRPRRHRGPAGAPDGRDDARLRRAGRGHRLSPGPRGDRGADGAGLDGAGLHLLRPRRGHRARRRRSSGSRADGSWSTWSTCPSSARWRRSSSASWPTGTSTSAASATGSS